MFVKTGLKNTGLRKKYNTKAVGYFFFFFCNVKLLNKKSTFFGAAQLKCNRRMAKILIYVNPKFW